MIWNTLNEIINELSKQITNPIKTLGT